ncbi:MAG: LOG family protein [Candidatus Vogelbacteria bacterium]|nr:LOG family protein [Candidatus Vogelbacteria bacterium]
MHLDPKRHEHLKVKICVSGAAETGHCGDTALANAKALGREVVLQGAVLVTGATTGFPLWAAMGAKEAGGISLGLSPASSEREHSMVYKLPLEYLDLIIYTGFGYSGRNLLLTRASDAVIVGCGRIGTVNEFTVAYEDGKPLGVLEGEWETDEVIKNMMEKSHRKNEKVLFDTEPARLVSRLIEIVQREKMEGRRAYRTPENIESSRQDGLIL